MLVSAENAWLASQVEESADNLVVNGRCGHTMLFEHLCNVCLLLLTDVLLAALHAVVESLAEMFHQILLDG